MVEDRAVISAQRTARAEGWSLNVAKAIRIEAHGISAGAAVAARSIFGTIATNLWTILVQIAVVAFVVHTLGGFCRGGIHVLSAYAWCSEWLSKRNLDLLQVVAQIISTLHGRKQA